MLRTISKENAEAFAIKLPPELSGLFQSNYDRVLADDSLSDLDVIRA
jgi:hypothetical protein